LLILSLAFCQQLSTLIDCSSLRIQISIDISISDCEITGRLVYTPLDLYQFCNIILVGNMSVGNYSIILLFQIP
jgi:hypothetical protein